MPESVSSRLGWVLPMLLAIAISAALGLGYLQLIRPNAGELGAVRVVIVDDEGKSSGAIRIVVAEAPLAQKETVSPGTAFAGTVNYPTPYLTKPNLKLVSGKRRYTVREETELGFTWVANPLPDDFREDANKEDPNKVVGALESILGGLELAATQGKLKPGLSFEDFTWEAKGPRAPLSTLPPKTFVQKGTFNTVFGQESVVFFPIPYAAPPNVVFTRGYGASVIVAECTPHNFKWRNVAAARFGNEGDVDWTATGILAPAPGK